MVSVLVLVRLRRPDLGGSQALVPPLIMGQSEACLGGGRARRERGLLPGGYGMRAGAASCWLATHIVFTKDEGCLYLCSCLYVCSPSIGLLFDQAQPHTQAAQSRLWRAQVSPGQQQPIGQGRLALAPEIYYRREPARRARAPGPHTIETRISALVCLLLANLAANLDAPQAVGWPTVPNWARPPID